jgi:predicted  nucleic acid-binding Zn-ribbon protein
MTGFHERALEKLEEEVSEAKQEHQNWLERQAKETNDWHEERKELNDKIEDLNKNITDLKKKHSNKENKLTEALNEKGM